MNKLVKYIIESRFNFNIDQLDIDNKNDFSLSKQLYKSKSMKLEYMENDMFVDLGLLSGTKWCKYNLGCDFELLSFNPENTKPSDWYGKYYSWGEIENKDEYTWETYKYAKDDDYEELTKYCSNPDYGIGRFTDNLVELLPEDDAAYQYDSDWRIPTYLQCQELIDYTNSKWITGEKDDSYMNVKGLAGRLFISKVNRNLIFIPAAGEMYDFSLYGDGSHCHLWSSNFDMDYPNYAWALYLSSNIYLSSNNVFIGSCFRFSGQSIRSVK